MSNRYERSAMVYSPCAHGLVPVDDVVFLDVHEGPQGEDVLRYICRECQEEHEGKVYA